jgi:transposase
VPDWSAVHRGLQRPNVTLALLWEEYRAATTDGSGYSWFCHLYREWAGRLKPTLRQVHIAGERLLVDFAGHTMEVIDASGSLTTFASRMTFPPSPARTGCSVPATRRSQHDVP